MIIDSNVSQDDIGYIASMFLSQHVEFFANLNWHIFHAFTLKDYSEIAIKWTILFYKPFVDCSPLALKSFFNDKSAGKDVGDLVGRYLLLVLRSSGPAVWSMPVNHTHALMPYYRPPREKKRESASPGIIWGILSFFLLYFYCDVVFVFVSKEFDHTTWPFFSNLPHVLSLPSNGLYYGQHYPLQANVQPFFGKTNGMERSTSISELSAENGVSIVNAYGSIIRDNKDHVDDSTTEVCWYLYVPTVEISSLRFGIGKADLTCFVC